MCSPLLVRYGAIEMTVVVVVVVVVLLLLLLLDITAPVDWA